MLNRPNHNSHLIDYMGINVLKASHPQVRKLKRQQQGHSAHGNKVWRSSFVLMDYLSTWEIPPGSKVLDVGCGWGLAGVYLTKHYQAEVTGLDIDDSVEPFFKLQAEINQCTIKFEQRSFESLNKHDLAPYHTLMGTDICFWDELVDPVAKMIDRAIDAGVGTIVIGDPERPTFYEMADKVTEKHGGEVLGWRLSGAVKATGALLVIHND